MHSVPSPQAFASENNPKSTQNSETLSDSQRRVTKNNWSRLLNRGASTTQPKSQVNPFSQETPIQKGSTILSGFSAPSPPPVYLSGGGSTGGGYNPFSSGSSTTGVPKGNPLPPTNKKLVTPTNYPPGAPRNNQGTPINSSSKSTMVTAVNNRFVAPKNGVVTSVNQRMVAPSNNTLGTSNKIMAPNKQICFNPFSSEATQKPSLPSANPFNVGENSLFQDEEAITTVVEMELMDESHFFMSTEKVGGKIERRFCDVIAKLCKAYPIQEVSESNNIAKWKVDNEMYEVVMKELGALRYVHVNGLPEIIVKLFIDKGIKELIDLSTADPDLDKQIAKSIPAQLWANLYPYQRQGIRFGIRNKGKLLIGDEMGLGKTLQAIALSIYYKSHWPLLIICPASLQNQWHNEFMKWGKPESSLYHIQFLTQQQLDMEPIKQKNRIYIMSFNLATTKTLPKFISQIDCLIVDESHYLKSDKAQRTRFLIPIIQRSTHSILLSGTASPSRPSELFTQLNALQPKIFSSFSAFGYRYCDGSSGNFKGASHLQELHTFLKSTVMIRRVKDDVLKDLPPKTRYCIKLHLQPNRLLQEQYEKFMGNQEMADLLDDPYDMMESCLNQKSTTKAMDSQIMEFFRKSGIAKKSLLKQYLNYIFKQFPDKKILFFGHHKAVLDSISSEYPSNFYIRIDGTTPKEQRHKEVQRFQTDESCRLGVLSILAAGTGLNLTAADTVIFGELYWNPGALCQAEDRAHRIGARGPVSVYYLLCDNTIDNFIWKKVNKKLEVTGLTLDGKFGELSGFVQEFKEDNVLDGELVDELCGDLNENEGDKEDQEPFVDDPGVLFPVDDVQEQEIDNLVFGEDEMNQKEGLQEEIVPVENNKRKIPTNSNPYQLIKKRKL